MSKTPKPDAAPDTETLPGTDVTTVDPGADAAAVAEAEAKAQAEAAEAEAAAQVAANAQAKADTETAEAEAAQADADRLAAEAAAQAETDAQAKADTEAAEAKARADAEADAAHQRKVQAKAAKDTKAAERAAKADETARADRLERLNRYLVIIEKGNTPDLRAGLITSLTGGTEATFDEEIFSFLDITVLQAATSERTLADWCMEARRQIMALAD